MNPSIKPFIVLTILLAAVMTATMLVATMYFAPKVGLRGVMLPTVAIVGLVGIFLTRWGPAKKLAEQEGMQPRLMSAVAVTTWAMIPFFSYESLLRSVEVPQHVRLSDRACSMMRTVDAKEGKAPDAGQPCEFAAYVYPAKGAGGWYLYGVSANFKEKCTFIAGPLLSAPDDLRAAPDLGPRSRTLAEKCLKELPAALIESAPPSEW